MSEIDRGNIFKSFTEKLKGKQREIYAENIDEVVKLANLYEPTHLNMTVLEIRMPKDRKKGNDIENILYIEQATVVSFGLTNDLEIIATYLEKYEESRVYLNDGKYDKEKLDEMKVRAILTAANRKNEISSRLPNIPILFLSLSSNGDTYLSDLAINYIKVRNKEKGLSPFI